jgi:PKD repeat protein
MYQYAADYIDYSCVTVDRGVKGKTQHEFSSWADAARRDYVNEYTRQRANNLNTCPNDPLHPSRRGSVLPLPFSLGLNGLSMGYADGISADFPARSSRAAERGLPTKVQLLNTAGLPVSETLYRYDFAHPGVSLPTVTGVYIKPDMEVLGFSQYPMYFQLYYYNHDAKWIPLVETTEIVYDQQSAGNTAKRLVNTTLLDYTNFHPSKITKFAGFSPRSASATAYVTEFRRPLDFTTGTTPASLDQTTTPAILRAAGITEAVVEEEAYQLKPNGAKLHMGATLSEYQLLNGRVLPIKTYATKTNISSFTPASTSQITGNVWALNRDASYLPVATINNYTAEGLPANTISREGVAQATIWGYGRTVPIAIVQNGRVATETTGSNALATAGHTSFEENGTDSDNWSLPNRYSTDAKTGSRSAHYMRNQSEYGFSKSLLIPAGEDRRSKLIFSCWAKIPASSNASTNFCLVTTSAAPQSGYQQDCFIAVPNKDWQHFEATIDLTESKWNANIASTQDLRLSCYLWMPWGAELLVDEVRIHRADATMETVTHQALVGRTSVSSPAGVTTYFTYNADHTPRLVLNHNRDIIQRTRQHVVGQTSQPMADFAMPAVTSVNCPAVLTAASGSCGSGTFTWDFGDGRTAINSTPVQNLVYAQPGTYQVTLTVADQDRGTSRISKAITVREAFYTEMDIRGNLYVNLCETPNPDPVVLTALTPNTCQNLTYRWQIRRGTQSWSDLGEISNTYSHQITYGTVFIRCIVGQGGSDNSNSPDLQEIQLTGYIPSPTNGSSIPFCPAVDQP